MRILTSIGKIPWRSLLSYRIRLPFTLILVILSFAIGLNFSQGIFGGGVKKISLFESYEFEGIKIYLSEVHSTNKIRLSSKNSQAPQDKKFLVFFTEVENASSSARQIGYGNWFRLEEEGKKLAPLPLNISFTVPAKATVEKQLVFMVEENKNKFNLLIGPLEGENKAVEIKL